MTPFHVGMKVVCVDDSVECTTVPGQFEKSELDGLTKGQVYTVRGFWTGGYKFYNVGDLYLEEITRNSHPAWGGEAPFYAARFRPVVKTDISIFTSMLAPSPIQTRETV